MIHRILTTAGTAINSIAGNTSSTHDVSISGLDTDPVQVDTSSSNQARPVNVTNDTGSSASNPSAPTFDPEELFGISDSSATDADASYESMGNNVRTVIPAAPSASPTGVTDLVDAQETGSTGSVGYTAFLEAYPDIAQFIRDANAHIAAAARANVTNDTVQEQDTSNLRSTPQNQANSNESSTLPNVTQDSDTSIFRETSRNQVTFRESSATEERPSHVDNSGPALNAESVYEFPGPGRLKYRHVASKDKPVPTLPSHPREPTSHDRQSASNPNHHHHSSNHDNRRPPSVVPPAATRLADDGAFSQERHPASTAVAAAVEPSPGVPGAVFCHHARPEHQHEHLASTASPPTAHHTSDAVPGQSRPSNSSPAVTASHEGWFNALASAESHFGKPSSHHRPPVDPNHNSRHFSSLHNHGTRPDHHGHPSDSSPSAADAVKPSYETPGAVDSRMAPSSHPPSQGLAHGSQPSRPFSSQYDHGVHPGHHGHPFGYHGHSNHPFHGPPDPFQAHHHGISDPFRGDVFRSPPGPILSAEGGFNPHSMSPSRRVPQQPQAGPHDGRTVTDLPQSGSRLFPNARTPPSHQTGSDSQPVQPPPRLFPSPAFRGTSVLVSRYDRGYYTKDRTRVHQAATKPLSSDYLLDFIPVDSGSDPIKLAEHYTSTDLCIQQIKEQLHKYDMLDQYYMYETFDFDSGAVYGVQLDIFDAAPRLSPDVVVNWISFARPRWTPEEQESDSWALEFFLSALSPDLKKEVILETQDYADNFYTAMSVAYITLRKVFSSTFEHYNILEQVITSFDIRKYPEQNVITAGQHITAASKALKAISRIPGQCLTSILRGMSYSDCTEFNSRCTSLMNSDHVDSPSVFAANSDRQFTWTRSLITKVSSWYRGYINTGRWPAVSSSRPLSLPSSTFTASQTDPHLLEQALALLGQRSPRRSPSAANPCLNCGSHDHWKNECPHPPNQRSGARHSNRFSQRSDDRHRPSSRGRTPDRRRSDSRDRGYSNDRGRSRDRSSSRDRGRFDSYSSQTSRDRSKSRDNDKTVSFGAVNIANNVGRSYSSHDDEDNAPTSAAVLLARLNQDESQSKGGAV